MFNNKGGRGNFIPIPKAVNNKRVRNNAEGHVFNMKKKPSWLEKKMMEFLDNHKIKYEFKKIFYISSRNFIKHYYIADFYISRKDVVLELDDVTHHDIKYDEYRTWNIKKHLPKIRVMRWKASDFHSYNNMKKLLEMLK